MKEPDYGQVAFEGYCVAMQWITYDGKPIPAWDKLGEEVRKGWRSAARAVRQQIASTLAIEANFMPLEDAEQEKA